MSKIYPLIRFSSYKDSWKKQGLESFVKFSRGKGYAKKDVLVEASNEILLYGMLYTDYNTRIESTKQYANLIPGSVISKGNEIVIPSSGETAVDIARASAILTENIILGGDLNVLTLKTKDVSTEYLALQLTNGPINIELVKKAQGHSVVHLYNSDLKKINISLPILEEQTRIGEFFKELDELIELQQLNIERLKEMKKGFLNKIYSKSSKIKIMDSSLESKWRKTTIGELSEISRGASPRPISDPKWFDEASDVGWLRIADVTEQQGRIRYLEQKLSKEGQEKTRVLQEPHLMLSIAASVGKPVINYVNTGVHDGFLIFKNPQFDIDFMFYFLVYYEKHWMKYGQPGSQVNLNSSIVRNQKVYIPAYEEQIKISNFFKKIDDLIELETEELEALQEMKKGFLQKMLV